jgi:hypothetical protein
VGRRDSPIDVETRRDLARKALAGYVNGPAAATEATARALEEVDGASAVVLVEGVSDQIAVETLAVRRSNDLDAEGIVIVPMGGAHAVVRYLEMFGPGGMDVRLAGLCDAAEEEFFRRGLTTAGIGSPRTRADMETLGFYVCVDDLEDELLRAVGSTNVETLFDSQGDLGSFRILQSQPAWRDRSVDAQMRRFLGSGARRKLRYARLLVEAVNLDDVPAPLDAALSHVTDV